MADLVVGAEDVKRFGTGAGTSIAGRLAGRGLNFITQAFLARQLGPGSYGLYSIGWALLRAIALLGPVGMDSAIIRYGTKYWQREEQSFKGIIYLTTGISILTGLLSAAVFYFGATWISSHFFKKDGLEQVIRAIAIAAPFVVVLRQLASTTTVSRQIKYAMISEEITPPVTQLALLFGLSALVGWTIGSSMLALVLSFVLSCIFAAWFVVRLFPEALQPSSISFSMAPEVFAFSAPTALAGFFGSFALWADRLVVGYFLVESDMGIYATLSLITGLFVIILSGIKVIYSPMIAQYVAHGEYRQIEALYRLGTRWGLYASIPLFIIISLSSKTILGLAFGAGYVQGSSALVILSIAQMVNVCTGPFDILLVMTGHQKLWLNLSALMLIGNVVLVSILAPLLGLHGAALGMAASVILISLLGIIMVYRVFKMSPYDRKYWKGLVAAMATFIIFLGILVHYQPSGLIELCIALIGCYAIFALCLYLLGFEKEDLDMLRVLKARLVQD